MRCTRILAAAILTLVASLPADSPVASHAWPSVAQQSEPAQQEQGQAANKSITPPRKVKHVAPEYPEDALRAGLRGEVVVEMEIDPNGNPRNLRVLQGVPPLTDAAIKAVRQWRFTPPTASTVVTVTVTFQRDLKFDLRGLERSLRSNNEYIREAAAAWLGKAREQIEPGAGFRIVHDLQYLAEHDDSERVRVAAAQAVVQLTPEKQ